MDFCNKGATDKLEKISELAMTFVFKDKHTTDTKNYKDN